ncbi:MAG: NUDIX hydrolase [Acidimicrobiales bacterium]
MSEERIDVVSPATGEVLATEDRTVVHADGLWHQVFHCLVLRPVAQSIVLQRRAFSKAAFPGLLDLSATGHLEAGERPLDGLREFEEELGIQLDPEHLIPLGTRLLADDNGEGKNRERVHVFFVLDDRPISDYRPPSHEVAGLVEIKVIDLLAILSDPELRVEARSTVNDREVVGNSDLVEGADGYWTVLAVMAQRALAGESLLAV